MDGTVNEQTLSYAKETLSTRAVQMYPVFQSAIVCPDFMAHQSRDVLIRVMSLTIRHAPKCPNVKIGTELMRVFVKACTFSLWSSINIVFRRKFLFKSWALQC